ncbi:MAG: DUF971 domain-containing protein [Planctomycetes bacterium]|nr:DUF971 domain-containing protein [Planctomycetota bacterium]
MKKKAYPLHVEKADDSRLYVRWSDHHESFYPVADLRRACVCAQCVDEMSGQPILNPADVPDTVKPVKVSSLGRYALAVDWTDGHTSSIYSWAKLRELANLEV